MARYKLSEVVMRIKDKVDKDNTELEYYIGGEHFDNGEICITKRGIIKESTIGPAFHMRFKPGDVLLMSRNPHLRKAGVVDFEGICSDVSYVCRTRDENVLMQRFLPFIFQTDAFWKFAEENKGGSTNFFLNWSDFERYEFALPSIEEQRQLTEILWAAQNAKLAYKELLRQTDELVKSQFIELFGDIPAEDYKSLSDVCKIITDGTHQPPKFVDKGIPFLLVSNITSNAITYDTPKYITKETYDVLMKRTPVEIGDILLSTVGSYGHPAIVKDTTPFSFQRHIAYLKPDSSIINSVYLHTAILSEDVQNQIEVMVLGVAQKTLNLSSIRGIKIPVPSLARQLSFNLFVEQTDKSKFEIKKAIENTSALIKSLMQQDLTN